MVRSTLRHKSAITLAGRSTSRTGAIALEGVRPLGGRSILSKTTARQATAHTAAHSRSGHTSGLSITGAKRAQQSQDELNEVYARVQVLATSILRSSEAPVPSEERVLYALEQLSSIATTLVDPGVIRTAAIIDSPKRGGSATSALLGSVNRKPPTSITKATLLNIVSSKAEEILRHPNVFITPKILQTYVDLQCLLQRPAGLADAFQLYAVKPTPTARGKDQVSYASPDPTSFKAAIPQETANKALDAAIASHDLSLALSIIDTSFGTQAFVRAKVIRRGAIPGGAFAMFPVLAYGASLQFSAWQTMLDPGQATMMAFAGFMTYAAAVGSVGYVAITTANDQMQRVTWAIGTPLWERWTREEERAALDKVAVAWGFKDLSKRGDEEGEDWDALRETCGVRGMVLDAVALMEGME